MAETAGTTTEAHRAAERHIRHELRPLEDLASADINPKRHADKQIAASIDALGFIEVPVLDERTGKLIAGHGRRDSLIRRKTTGLEPPEGVSVDAEGRWCLMTTVWRSQDDAEAHAAGAGLNRLPELGGWDDADTLAVLIQAEDAGYLGLTGFDQDDIVMLRGDFEPGPEDEQPRLDEKSPVTCPKCQHEFVPR